VLGISIQWFLHDHWALERPDSLPFRSGSQFSVKKPSRPPYRLCRLLKNSNALSF